MSKERKLTPEEETLARTVFGDSIHYEKVRVHEHGYIFFQPSRSGITPNGEIYVKCGDPSICRPNYAAAALGLRAFFIHEMAHVWQKHNKVLSPVFSAIGEFIRNRGNYNRAYTYKLKADKDLLEYRIEQQASIIEEYYKTVLASSTKPPADHLKLLESVLAKFIKNPKYPRSER